MKEKSTNRFTWGDSVVIKQNAPKHLHPGEGGSICSVDQILSKEAADKFQANVGEWFYTVELGGGSDIQVPEQHLDRDPTILHGKTLSKYSHYLIHGYVLNIKANINLIEIQIKSLPIYESISSEIMLSTDDCLKGKIIAAQIESMTINHRGHFGLEQKGTIAAIDVSDHALKLLINWGHHKTTSIEIKSGTICWNGEL